MKVELLTGTSFPERVVCRCARGDYRREGVGNDYRYEEIMSEVEPKDKWLEEANEHFDRYFNDDAFDEMAEMDAKTMTMIERLYNKRHLGPFEHPQATFSVEGISRSCMAQLTRHRHATFDVQSMRYVDFSGYEDGDDVEEHVVVPDSVNNEIYREHVAESFKRYEELLSGGAAEEDARMVLPIGTKVNLTFSMNARSLMHLLDMRMKADAQWEIRELTNKLLEEAKDWMPTTFELYEEDHPNRLEA